MSGNGLEFVWVILFGYIVGSVPTSIWVCKWLRGMDIRDHGSGNAGATNVFRVVGWKIALGVAIIDVLKGALAVYFSRHMGGAENEPLLMAGGLSAMLGHVYTVFAGFKGGKGVLVALGVFLLLTPPASIASLFLWMLLVWLTRYVSVGSMVAACVLPGFTYLFSRWCVYPVGKGILIFTALAGLLVLFTHRSNAVRLLKGTENRFGRKKKAVP